MNSSIDTRPTFVARTPEDVLALARVALGFEPTASIVMLTFGAEHTFHARLDLPAPDAPGAAEEISAGVAAMIRPAVRHGVRSVLLIFYSDDITAVGRMLGPLQHELDEAGIGLLDALRAHDGRWYPLCSSGAEVRRGVAYDIDAHPFIVESVLSGRVTRGTRAELAATVAADPAAVERVEAALARVSEEDLERVDGRRLREVLTQTDAPGARAVLSDHDTALLLLAVQDRQLADAAWCLLPRADPRAQVELWSDVVRRAPQRLVAAPAAILGWAAWMAGDGALAWCAVDRGTRVDPEEPLLLLLAATLTEAVPPRTVWG